MGKTYGYARVSTRGQNLDRQLDAFDRFGIEPNMVYADRYSGKDFDRPAYRRMLRRVRKGDLIVVSSIDRLGRDYEEIQAQWRMITREKGADMLVLDMPLLDTRVTPSGVTGVFVADMVLQVLSYVAQIERDEIRQRQREGIDSAMARGVRFGRPRIEKPAQWPNVRDAYMAGDVKRLDAAAELGISPRTFDAWMRAS